MDVRAVAVQKTVSQPAASQRLLVRATLTCTRTSASVQTLSHHAVTAVALQIHAVHQSHAVHQQTRAATAAQLTQAAVLRLVTAVATAAMLTQAAVLQPATVVATAATLTQAAVLQPLVEQLLTHHAVLQPATAVATAAPLTQPVLLRLHVVTAAETAVAKAAATMTAAKLRS